MMPPTCARTSAVRSDSKRPGNSVVNATVSGWTVTTPTTGGGISFFAAVCCCPFPSFAPCAASEPLLHAERANAVAAAIAAMRITLEASKIIDFPI
jgi:hypothetical protein